MDEQWPKFGIFAVKDGDAYGLLVKRQLSQAAPEEREYFWMEKPGWLAPTRELKIACEQCYLLRGQADEDRIARELIDYAVAAQKSDGRPVKQIACASPGKKGYQGVVDHFFQRGRVKSPLKEFFLNGKTFKEKVLGKISEDTLIGRAEEFGVVSAHTTVRDVECIRRISHILWPPKNRIRIPLRKQGPIAVDFGQKIYRRGRLLDELRTLLHENEFCLLIGRAGTGKTVLARQLGYELHNEGQWPVYYWDCDRHREFDPTVLTQAINNVKGVVIIENIHLELHRFQLVYELVESHPRRHVLLTARPFDARNQRLDRSNLCGIEALTLKPSEDLDEIIEHFAHLHSEVKWPPNARNAIKSLSGGNLWLLAYALNGYVDARGEGSESIGWIKDSAEDDLRELQSLDTSFPEVVVALSPLYHNEVLTEEIFLTNVLGFNVDTLQKLVQRGDITVQEVSGHVLYGLPHSALAEVYWAYGGQYKRRRELPDYEDFVYKYAVARMVNGLQAIVRSVRGSEERIIRRLRSKGELSPVIAAERSMEAIARAIWHMAKSDNKSCFSDSDFQHVMARKVLLSEDLHHSAFALSQILRADEKSGSGAFQTIGSKRLASKLSKASDFCGVGDFLSHVGRILFWDCPEKLSSMLDLREIAEGVTQHANFMETCVLLSGLLEFDNKKGRQLWRLLGAQELADRMTESAGSIGCFRALLRLYRADRKVAQGIWSSVDKKRLAISVSIEEDLSLIGEEISCLLQMTRGLAREFCQYLDLSRIAARLVKSPGLGWTSGLLGPLAYADERLAKRLCDLLDTEELARRISQEDTRFMDRVMESVGGQAADWLSQNEHWYADSIVECISRVNKQVGTGLQRLVSERVGSSDWDEEKNR